MDKYLGKRLDGRYEIRELIGIGGMANVYKAYDKLEDRMVAVKILKDEYLHNEEFLRRFRNESKAIAVLSHPNIVKVFDVSFGNNIQYIVMEYIDGITLKEYIEQQKILRWKEAVHFTVQILRALQHAHDKGIVHRDIKPHNIMLLQDGTIKVMDFGIARFARDERKITTNKAIGSVHYISPEQARGEATDEKTDIYAVGVMLYEMLTGRLPFDGTNPEAIAVMHMQSTPRRPRELNDTIPEGLEEITLRAMQKEPSMRYQSAAEMLRDIDEFKRNPSIVFEYKYFNDEGTTKYFNAVNGGGMGGFDDEDDEEDDKPQKSRMIPILAGIACAFVVVTGIILLVIFGFGFGPKTGDVLVEDLKGKVYNELINDPNFKFKLEVVANEYNDNYEAGQIYEQSIDPGRKVKEGTTIEVAVSKGKRQVEVPDVYNKSSAEAEQMLKEAELEVSITKSYDPSVATDHVIRTVPARKEMTAVGTKVVVYVSMGEADNPVTVPNVVGKQQDAAIREINGKNLKYTIHEVDSSETKGKVISQSPSSGVVNEGDTITLTVSNGNAPSKTVSFSGITLPTGATGEYSYQVYMDGVKQGSAGSFNATVTSKFPGFTLKGSSSAAEVTVVVWEKGKSESSGARFLTYTVDFSKGTKTQVSRNDSVFRLASPSSSEPAAPSSSEPASTSSDSGTESTVSPNED